MALHLIHRRQLLNLGITAATTSGIVNNDLRAQDNAPTPRHIIDTNVSLFQWPFRRLPLDDTDALIAKLRGLGITQAWAGSFEGLLHRDITAVNRRLAEACQQRTELVAVGSVNPELPGWEKDLRRCFEDHNMPGIRVHPNYHGYTLNDQRFARLLELATEAGRFVQLATTMEDTRTQHPLVRVTDVDLAPLPTVMSLVAGARLQLLNYRPNVSQLNRLTKTPGLYFDTARVEATDGVPQLLKLAPSGRVLFGTHAPQLVPEAALIRVNESGLLDTAAVRAILSENAKQFMETNHA